MVSCAAFGQEREKEIMNEANRGAIERLVARGVLKVCRYCGEPLPTDAANRRFCNKTCKRAYERQRRQDRISNVKRIRTRKQIEFTERLKADKIARMMDNARRLMIYIAGEERDGGKRLWFRRHDIEVAGICDDYVFSGHNSFWIEMMDRLVATGMVEKRKAEGGSGGCKGKKSYNEYRFVKLDEDFFE